MNHHRPRGGGGGGGVAMSGSQQTTVTAGAALSQGQQKQQPYEHDDDDSDEEDLVQYGDDTPAQDHRARARRMMMSQQQSQQSSRSSMIPAFDLSSQKSTMIHQNMIQVLPRGERVKRRHQFVETLQEHLQQQRASSQTTSLSSQSNHHSTTGSHHSSSEEDPFAALESLLEQQQHPQDPSSQESSSSFDKNIEKEKRRGGNDVDKQIDDSPHPKNATQPQPISILPAVPNSNENSTSAQTKTTVQPATIEHQTAVKTTTPPRTSLIMQAQPQLQPPQESNPQEQTKPQTQQPQEEPLSMPCSFPMNQDYDDEYEYDYDDKPATRMSMQPPPSRRTRPARNNKSTTPHPSQRQPQRQPTDTSLLDRQVRRMQRLQEQQQLRSSKRSFPSQLQSQSQHKRQRLLVSQSSPWNHNNSSFSTTPNAPLSIVDARYVHVLIYVYEYANYILCWCAIAFVFCLYLFTWHLTSSLALYHFILRPSHWAARSVTSSSTTQEGNNNRNYRPQYSYQRLANSRALMAATRRVTLSPVPPQVQGASAQRRSAPPPPTNHKKANENAHPQTQGQQAQQAPSSVPVTNKKKRRSFAPSFLQTATNKAVNDQVEEAPPDDEDNFNDIGTDRSPPRRRSFHAATAAASSSPYRRSPNSKGAKGSGPLVKRLLALRNTLATDTARLSAHHNNMTGSTTFDLNDPRKRADSVTDLTIVRCYNDSTTATNSGTNTTKQVVALAMVHRHTTTTSKEKQHNHTTPFWTWASFDRVTARSIHLHQHQQLRIYNGVFLPIRKEQEEPSTTTTCQHILVCTQLCEPYPSNQAALPTVEAILGGPTTSAVATTN